jgi:hypothetical protein
VGRVKLETSLRIGYGRAEYSTFGSLIGLFLCELVRVTWAPAIALSRPSSETTPRISNGWLLWLRRNAAQSTARAKSFRAGTVVILFQTN